MPADDEIDAALVRSLIDYDHMSGIVTWRARHESLWRSTPKRSSSWECARWNSRHSGSVAGSKKRNDGYHNITIRGRHYRLHRIIWLWMTGEWPGRDIDHIDGDRSNNRWDNLRTATRGQNSANRGPHKNSKSGVKGVCLRGGKWVARVKQKYIGSFETLPEAMEAYEQEAAKEFGAFARRANDATA